MLGAIIQDVGMPIFLETFIQGPGLPAYFSLWICYLFFAVVFGAAAAFLVHKGEVTEEMREWRWHKYMALIGFVACSNGILAAYSNFLSRVPGPINAILSNSVIVFTMVFSKILLSKVHTLKQMVGAGLVFVGIAVSLVPTFISIQDAGQGATWWWTNISLISYVPNALVNVLQERMQDLYRAQACSRKKRYSIIYYQANVCAYQLFWLSLLFWVDVLPNFGLSDNLTDTFETFGFDWTCFWGTPHAKAVASRCAISAPIGLLFMFSFVLMYVSSAALTMYTSANLLAVLLTMAPLLSAVFWFVFPAVNAWAGGSALTYVDLAFNLGAFPAIIVGVLIYRYFEVEDKTPSQDELSNGPVELCW